MPARSIARTGPHSGSMSYRIIETVLLLLPAWLILVGAPGADRLVSAVGPGDLAGDAAAGIRPANPDRFGRAGHPPSTSVGICPRQSPGLAHRSGGVSTIARGESAAGGASRGCRAGL